MVTVVNSSYVVGHAQRDGRRYVVETHLDSNGVTHVAEYLADIGTDYVSVMDARALSIADYLNQEIEEAANG